MQKPTFSLDCSEAAEQIELPPTEMPVCESFHLLAVMGDHLIVCVHDANDETEQFAMPQATRECLPEEDDLQAHFQRLMRAQFN